MLENLLLSQWLEDFEITSIEERKSEWRIILTEKPELIPAALKGLEAVSDGFLNPVEVIDFPLRGKLTYLEFRRRRWKESGDTQGHFNHYELHARGAKVTPSFGSFLKELTGDEFNQLCLAWPDLRDCRQEAR